MHMLVPLHKCRLQVPLLMHPIFQGRLKYTKKRVQRTQPKNEMTQCKRVEDMYVCGEARWRGRSQGGMVPGNCTMPAPPARESALMWAHARKDSHKFSHKSNTVHQVLGATKSGWGSVAWRAWRLPRRIPDTCTPHCKEEIRAARLVV